jgi:probable blue pigment (indigoidine) exporter
VTAVAPVAWGSTYYVTHAFLPPDYPLWGSVIRALPAGLLLLAVRRQLPRGVWWWRSLVLGVLNVGLFFALIYLAAHLLPTSVASTIMATAPVAMMLVAWALLSERPRLITALASALGIVGVGLMVLTGPTRIDPGGVAVATGAMLLSSVGFVLSRRWTAPSAAVPGQERVDVLASTAWQLVAGGLLLLPAAVAVEGGPPPMDARTLPAFAYLAVVCTAIAFVAWFTGLRHLHAGTVGVVGLLNPVTGVLLGTGLAAEVLSGRQVAGIVLVLVGVLAGQLGPSAVAGWRDRLRRLASAARSARRPAPAAATSATAGRDASRARSRRESGRSPRSGSAAAARPAPRPPAPRRRRG